MQIEDNGSHDKYRLRREHLEKWKLDRLPLLNQQLAKRPLLSPPNSDPTKRPKASPANPDYSMAQALAQARAAAASVLAHATDPPADVTPPASTETEVDELDQFMVSVQTEVNSLNDADAAARLAEAADQGPTTNQEFIAGDNPEKDSDSECGGGPEDILAYAAKKLAKKKDLIAVDHSAVSYDPFVKEFYIEPPDLVNMTKEQVKALRLSLDGIKILGRDPPKPVVKWSYLGVPVITMDVIRKHGFVAPTPIQAQAVPAIMAGRDVIGVAKTGSGKTLAFLLPMLRHIKAQRPISIGEGPIALIMTPTRELAMQIHKEARTFGKSVGLRSVCCYGGSPISDQIAELKRGAEMVVCTPGRLIDLLTANSGRVTNLRRVTFLVLDEADRMFDMGFEPQVMKIVANVRPDRQTVLFSATFPRKMEALARKILKSPLEVTVGGKSVVTSTVTQIVEVVEDENTKYLKLLEILGKWFSAQHTASQMDLSESTNKTILEDEPRVLIFVDRQESADQLLNVLFKRGYVCNALHGGKDQADRDSTISDFKAGIFPILVATSVAARGLDVKGLTLVVNYDCPNHKEDYVHRVGRTGRAGHLGTAVTYITPDQERYAGDLVDALKASGAPIPDNLKELAAQFKLKVKAGQAVRASSGFGGKGLEKLDKDRDLLIQAQKIAHGIIDEDEEDDGNGLLEEDEGQDMETDGDQVPEKIGEIVLPPTVRTANSSMPGAESSTKPVSAATLKVQDVLARINAQQAMKASAPTQAPALNAQSQTTAVDPNNPQAATAGIINFTCEFEINDYPQRARWRVTNKEQINQIIDLSGAAITTRGLYFAGGKTPGAGERKLYLFIEGETQLAVDKAKLEIARILREATLASVEMELKAAASSSGLTGGAGRYSVV